MPTTVLNASFRSTASGVLTTHDRDRQEFQDQDVLGLRVDTRLKNDAMGNIVLHKSLDIRVRDEQDDRWVSLEAEVGPWDDDPLTEVRQRLLNDLFERSWQTLLCAGDVEGDGWSLNLIQFSDVASKRAFPPQEISAVRWINDHVCLFHEDEIEPFARYHAEAENTLLLHRLLRQLVEDVAPVNYDSTSFGLGPLIDETSMQNMRWLSPRRVAVIGSVPVAILLLTLPLGSAATGIVVMLLAFLATLPVQTGTPATLRHYRNALVRTRGSEEEVLLSDQIGSMKVTHSTQALFDGTSVPHLHVCFASARRQSRKIEFSTVLTPTNRGSIDSIIVDVAKNLSIAMHDELRDKGRVVWTDSLTILPDVVLYRTGDESEEEVRVIQPTDITTWSVSDSTIVLALTDGSVISQSTSQRNFYPGLTLLRDRGWLRPVEIER